MANILISDAKLDELIKNRNVLLTKSLKIAISKLYRRYGPGKETLVTREELSSLLECGTPRVSVILKELEQQGLLTRTIRSHKEGNRIIPNCLYITINL